MNRRPIPTVVPLDGSGDSETILSCLKLPLRQTLIDATLFRVAAADNPPAAAEAKHYLEDVRRRLHSQRIEVFSALGLGRPAEEILLFAKARQQSLIAMTTHGRGVVPKALMGSVAEEVLRQARVPLLLTRPGDKGASWGQILVTLDGSPESELILPAARRLASENHALLHLLRITRDSDPVEYLASHRARLEAAGLKSMPVLRHGHPGEEIVRYAKESNIGLICMMSHHRSGISRLLTGSVTEYVLRHAACPLLVCPPEAAPGLRAEPWTRPGGAP